MHEPVLVNEILSLLSPQAGQVVVDGTVGYGGHAEALLKAAGGSLTYIGCDRDAAAVAFSTERLSKFPGVHLFQGSYETIDEQVKALNIAGADIILLDLGASSPQFDQAGRGFSFQQEGPLDMRFDVGSAGKTAADILNTYPQQELETLIRDYGEERFAKKIAARICEQREQTPFAKTSDLAQLIERAIPRSQWPKRIHPATRTFQALRIAVNDELGTIERALPRLLDLLKSGGRMGVISFHSLEDRLVKTFFKNQARGCICPPEFPVCRCGQTPTLRLITKKPVKASEGEQAANPRSRSALLRVVEKK